MSWLMNLKRQDEQSSRPCHYLPKWRNAIQQGLDWREAPGLPDVRQRLPASKMRKAQSAESPVSRDTRLSEHEDSKSYLDKTIARSSEFRRKSQVRCLVGDQRLKGLPTHLRTPYSRSLSLLGSGLATSCAPPCIGEPRTAFDRWQTDAGAGKSTLTRCVIMLAHALRVGVLVVASTGTAAMGLPGADQKIERNVKK